MSPLQGPKAANVCSPPGEDSSQAPGKGGAQPEGLGEGCPQRQSFFKFNFIFWLRWVFVAARGLSLAAVSGGYSSLRCAGFSLRWLLLLQSVGSRAQNLQ